jgi:hypothetical protein
VCEWGVLVSLCFNPFTPNDLKRRRALSPLKIKIPNKNLGRQRYAEGFIGNSVVKELKCLLLHCMRRNNECNSTAEHWL